MRQNFPELAKVDPDHITLCINGVVGGQRRKIRISSMAWDRMLPNLARYEVLDIVLKDPLIVVDPSGDESLPNYEDVKEKYGSDGFLSPSRGPSPRHKSVPLPKTKDILVSGFTRPLSRPPSSSSRSPSPSQKPSSNPSWVKGLFAKRSQ